MVNYIINLINRTERWRLALSLLLLLFLAGCATSTFYFTVKRAADINLKGYDKIAVGDFTGGSDLEKERGNDVRSEITTALFKSSLFEVVDREHIDRIIAEQKLDNSGLIDEKTAAEVGKVIGAAAFLSGRVQSSKYEEDHKLGSTYKDKMGKKKNTYIRVGSYNLIIIVKVVDIKTSKILAVKTLHSSAHDSSSATFDAGTSNDLVKAILVLSGNETKNEAPPIDQGALYVKCIKDVTAQFMKLISPYEDRVRANFEKDKMLPEVEHALAFFKAGEWEDGIGFLQSAMKKGGLSNEVKAKAYYNLGLAQTYTGAIDEAMGNLKEAIMLNPGSSAYSRALRKAKKEKVKAEKLKAQIL